MNTPTMSAEQLSPKMSPTMFHLDDNLPSLGAPSFMYLDDNKQYPTMYRTSLSKLSERGRQDRNRQVTPTTPTKLLRSNSPIRTMLNNAPKMLKPEYIAPPKLCFGKGISNIATPSMILTSSKLNFGAGLPKSSTKTQSHSRGLSSVSTTTSEATACEPCSGTSDPSIAVPTTSSVTVKNAAEYKFLAETSTASSSSTLDLKELPNELQFEMPMTKAEFVLATQSKRSSYISSVGSTQDDDLGEWFTNYPEDRQALLPTNESSEQREEALKSESILQSEHLALRIKQLELQVTELRLQNSDLRNSIVTHRTVQDKCMFDAFNEAQREKERTQVEMERKMKQLKRQIDNYKMVIKKLTSPVKTTPVSKPRVQMLDASTLDNIAEIETSDDDSANTSIDGSGNDDAESSEAQRAQKPSGFDLKVSLATR